MKKSILSTFIFFLTMSISAQEYGVDLSGEWTFTLETPQGKRSSDVSIKQEGDSATVWGREGEYVITIDGQNVSWNQNITTPMGSMAANFRGKILNENKMSGTTSISGGPMSGRSINWYANRKKTAEEIAIEKAKKKERKKKKKEEKKKAKG